MLVIWVYLTNLTTGQLKYYFNNKNPTKLDCYMNSPFYRVTHHSQKKQPAIKICHKSKQKILVPETKIFKNCDPKGMAQSFEMSDVEKINKRI